MNDDDIWESSTLKFDSKVNLFEDEAHEFKQFVVKSINDISVHIKKIGKYITAYLNSNFGYICLGITDNGVIKGIKMSDEYLNEFIEQFEKMLDGYEEHVINEEYVKIAIKTVDNDKKEDLYVIAIAVRKGKEDFVYTTPYKDDMTKDYIVYIKLNGIIKRIDGEDLYKYMKNKIKKFINNSYISK